MKKLNSKQKAYKKYTDGKVRITVWVPEEEADFLKKRASKYNVRTAGQLMRLQSHCYMKGERLATSTIEDWLKEIYYILSRIAGHTNQIAKQANQKRFIFDPRPFIKMLQHLRKIIEEKVSKAWDEPSNPTHKL